MARRRPSMRFCSASSRLPSSSLFTSSGTCFAICSPTRRAACRTHPARAFQRQRIERPAVRAARRSARLPARCSALDPGEARIRAKAAAGNFRTSRIATSQTGRAGRAWPRAIFDDRRVLKSRPVTAPAGHHSQETCQRECEQEN